MKLPATGYHNDSEYIAQDTAQTKKNVHASEEVTFESCQVRCVRPIPRHVSFLNESLFFLENTVWLQRAAEPKLTSIT